MFPDFPLKTKLAANKLQYFGHVVSANPSVDIMRQRDKASVLLAILSKQANNEIA